MKIIFCLMIPLCFTSAGAQVFTYKVQIAVGNATYKGKCILALTDSTVVVGPEIHSLVDIHFIKHKNNDDLNVLVTGLGKTKASTLVPGAATDDNVQKASQIWYRSEKAFTYQNDKKVATLRLPEKQGEFTFTDPLVAENPFPTEKQRFDLIKSGLCSISLKGWPKEIKAPIFLFFLQDKFYKSIKGKLGDYPCYLELESVSPITQRLAKILDYTHYKFNRVASGETLKVGISPD